MPKFKPILKRPGELIRSEDWNKIQEDVREDLERLEKESERLRAYIEMMTESVTLTNLESPVGKPYRLDEEVPGEVGSYATSVVGYITRQWLAKEGAGEICRFGVLSHFDVLYYWAAANNGNRRALEIVVEYVDGTVHVEKDVYVHEWSKLQPKGSENPYVEYLLSPNERVWYKYQLRNPHPDKEVRYVTFLNRDPECNVRVGNVLQHVSRVRPLSEL